MTQSLKRGQERKVAPGVYLTASGNYRIYLPGRDAQRFTKGPADGITTDAQAIAYREVLIEESAGKSATPAEGFAADADAYLKDPVTRAMPSYKRRVSQINKWIGVFGETPRSEITDKRIAAELQTIFNTGTYRPESIGKFRTALMALWTYYEGRHGANPVKATPIWGETKLIARGVSLDLLQRILDEVPDYIGQAIDRATLYGEVWREPVGIVAKRYGISGSRLGRVCVELKIPTPKRGHWLKQPEYRDAAPPLRAHKDQGKAPRTVTGKARLWLMAETGFDPIQVRRLEPEHFSLSERWYTLPRRKESLNGKPKRRMLRPDEKIEMTDEAAAAFANFVRVNAWGNFNGTTLLRGWVGAQRRLEAKLRKETGDPHLRLPHVRIKDIRHSFGTALYAATKDK